MMKILAYEEQVSKRATHRHAPTSNTGIMQTFIEMATFYFFQ